MSAKVIPRVVDQTSFLAGLIDKYKIVEHIDQLALVADDGRTNLTIGHRVKAILLSGLGFPERTLYQAHQQFEHLNGNFSKTGGLLTSNHFVLHDLRQRREHLVCESVLKIMPE